MKAIIIIRWFIIIYMVTFLCLDLYIITNSDVVTKYGWDNIQLTLLWLFAFMAAAVLYVTISTNPRRQ
jgi:hypothetical protein